MYVYITSAGKSEPLSSTYIKKIKKRKTKERTHVNKEHPNPGYYKTIMHNMHRTSYMLRYLCSSDDTTQ